MVTSSDNENLKAISEGRRLPGAPFVQFAYKTGGCPTLVPRSLKEVLRVLYKCNELLAVQNVTVQGVNTVRVWEQS